MQEMNRYKKKKEACIKFSLRNLLFAETISFFSIISHFVTKNSATHWATLLSFLCKPAIQNAVFRKSANPRWTRWANRWMIRLLVLLASLCLKVWWTMSWQCAHTSILRMWPKIWSSREVQQGQSTEFWMARSVKHLFLKNTISESATLYSVQSIWINANKTR